MTEQFSADIEAVEPDMPVSFRFNGKVYVGQKTPVVENLQMEDAGFSQRIDFDLIVRVNQFAAATPPVAPPINNSEIELQDPLLGKWVAYNINQVTPSQDGVAIQYAIEQKT